MIYSMTGYGFAMQENENYQVTVEIKSINNKNQDFFLKLPKYFAEEEIKIRNILATHLNKGKISTTIKVLNKKGEANSLINRDFFYSLVNELNSLRKELPFQTTFSLEPLLLIPNVFMDLDQKVSDEEWEITEKTLLQAIENLKTSRAQEGKFLQEDILNQLSIIEKLLPEIQNYEIHRIENIKLKLQNAYKELSSEISIPPERFEQELFFYLEKYDINEEKIRLQSHVQYFKETIKNEEIVGKKLQFIAQEMGREINTIGSKSYDFNIQKIVVEMKDALEKIKEQLNNIL